MSAGSLASHFDIAQITLYNFWLFFAGLLWYLRGEDKREGYPLEEADASPHTLRKGFPGKPEPKTFLLAHGGTRVRPIEWNSEQRPPINATPIERWPGAPLNPDGDPMLAGVGPGSWANRPDEPELTLDGKTKIIPIRIDASYGIDARDPDPRGQPVIGAGGVVGGKISDVWVDRSERLFRYLEVEIAGGAKVLLPVNFSRILADGSVRVASICGVHFANLPKLAKIACRSAPTGSASPALRWCWSRRCGACTRRARSRAASAPTPGSAARYWSGAGSRWPS